MKTYKCAPLKPKSFLLVSLFCIALAGGCSDKGTEPPLEDIEFDIMSFNMRYDNLGDEENRWDNRKMACISMLQETNPTIIGTQEGLQHQIDFLDENLPNYSYFGVGREDGISEGEYAAIFYKPEDFELIEEGTFWLSETPNTPSIGWDAALERIVTWGHLKESETKKSIYVFNTHFDHEGINAQINSAQLLTEKVAEIVQDTSSAIFLTGDFNGILVQTMFIPILAEYLNAQDSAPVTDEIKSFNGFGGGGLSGAITIDYVFHSKNVVALQYQTIDKDYGVPYISDHFPVIAKFRY